jgi:pimeloyl-ACP methyl ester carboxylesterase
MPEEFSLEHTAAHVQTLLKRLQVGPAFSLGVSMGAAIAMRIALREPLSVRGLIRVSPWSRTSEHTPSLVERLFRLAEVGDMSTHTDLFLRHVLPSAFLACRGQEVEHLRTLAMAQDAKAVAYTWGACMASIYQMTLRLSMHQALLLWG